MTRLKQNIVNTEQTAPKGSSSWLWPKGEPVFIANKPEPKVEPTWLWAKGEPVFVTKAPVRRGRRPKAAARQGRALLEAGQAERNTAPAERKERPEPSAAKTVPATEDLPSDPPPVRRENGAQSQEEPRAAQPVRATREEISAGKISRIWCARLARPDFALSFLWEGYFALQNNAVLNLQVSNGMVLADIEHQGKAKVKLRVSPVKPAQWEALVAKCGASLEAWATILIGNIVFEDIRRFYADPQGLMPSPEDIEHSCTCALSTAAGCVHTTTALLALGAWLQAHPLDLLTIRSARREVLFERSAILRGEQQVELTAAEMRILERQLGLPA